MAIARLTARFSLVLVVVIGLIGLYSVMFSLWYVENDSVDSEHAALFC